MTPSPDPIALHMARFLDTLDAAFRGYGVPHGLPPLYRDAVIATPRHRFVHRFRIGDGPLRDIDVDPAQNLPDIYSDAVMQHVDAKGDLLPSSNSQPSYVLFLLHLLGLEQGQAALEIGSGSGWLAAIMAYLVGPEGKVVGIELLPDLAAQSRTDSEALSFGNVTIITGDGTRGHPAGAPYDRAIITAATWDVPAALLDQVAGGGRVLVPVELRGGDGCDVTVLQRQGAVLVAERSVPGWFVPLQGGGQDRRADALASPPAGEATGRRSLPLGIDGNHGAAPAARVSARLDADQATHSRWGDPAVLNPPAREFKQTIQRQHGFLADLFDQDRLRSLPERRGLGEPRPPRVSDRQQMHAAIRRIGHALHEARRHEGLEIAGEGALIDAHPVRKRGLRQAGGPELSTVKLGEQAELGAGQSCGRNQGVV